MGISDTGRFLSLRRLRGHWFLASGWPLGQKGRNLEALHSKPNLTAVCARQSRNFCKLLLKMGIAETQIFNNYSMSVHWI